MNHGLNLVLVRNWWAVVLRGVAGLAFGLIALLLPSAAMLTLTWLFSAYLIVDGVFAILATVRAVERHERWWPLLIEGVLDLVLGVLIWAFPTGAILAFVLVTAGWALMTGVLMLASAFRLHAHGRFWLGLGGVISILFGLVLAASPVTGAVVLTWWVGAYALAFGVSLLVLGLRLRARRDAVGHRSPLHG